MLSEGGGVETAGGQVFQFFSQTVDGIALTTTSEFYYDSITNDAMRDVDFTIRIIETYLFKNRNGDFSWNVTGLTSLFWEA